MKEFCPTCHRRQFLERALLGSGAFFTAPGAFAEQLSLTPRQTEGPFYPNELPLDTDNDLIRVNDSIHTEGAPRGRERDSNFQGFGRFLTGRDGAYYFRAIKPVPYGPRTPHHHIAVYRNDKRVLTTQCYIRIHELNQKDRISNSISDPELRDLLIADFAPLPGSKAGELGAKFDIIVDRTPENPKLDDRHRGSGTGFRPDGRGKRSQGEKLAAVS